jgi:hypothetical protein
MPSHLNSFHSSGDVNTRRNALPPSSHLAKKRRVARLALWMPFLLCLSGAFVMKGAAAPNESLPFATSYTVTGDYVVGGVDLLPQQAVNGFVQGEIPITGVPANADIVAAYLLWETIYSGPAPAVGTVGAQFRGNDITIEWTNSVDSTDISSAFAPCWTSGGSNYTLAMHRADVLQFLPPQPDTNGGATGKRLVNTADLDKYGLPHHVAKLPDSGTGNLAPQSAGASLFIVYRDPSLTAKLTKVVFYNGLYIQTQGVAMDHTIRGFFDPAPNALGKLTHVVGSGAPNGNDRVYFNGNQVPNGLNRFDHAAGGTSDRAWSNPTFPDLPLTGMSNDGAPYGKTVTTKVDHGGNNSPNDCLTWSAIMFSVPVNDTDGDGLLDVHESSGGWKEPNDRVLPDIHAMADPAVKDAFIEIGYMTTPGFALSAGHGQGAVPAHSHRPTAAALKMVGDTLWCGGVAGCSAAALGTPNSNGVRVHFDVGSSYPAYTGADLYAERYIVRTNAKGGEEIRERFCEDDSTETCRFPAYPGTVGWKIGFQLYRDQPVKADGSEFTKQNGSLDTAAMDACELSGTCRRRFDFERKDFFHYALFGHATGIPKSPYPCLTNGQEALLNSQGACDGVPNPQFQIPSGISGGGDLPGGDFMVTMGFWDNYVGTDFFQASTILHEFGHNGDRWHGGGPPVVVEVGQSPNVKAKVTFEPNCKPNYLSAMSYMFQLHGLRDNAGVPHLDLSSVPGDAILENNLADSYQPAGAYLTSWYAPKVPGTLGYVLNTPAATRYCNGFKFPAPKPVGWTDFVRIDGSAVGASIDWSADQDFADTNFSQNVNFDADGNGDLDGSLTGLNGSIDWGNLRLNQLGARRNMAGFSAGLQWGGLQWGGADGLNDLGLQWGGLVAGHDADDAGGGLGWGGLQWGGLQWGGLQWSGLQWGGLQWGGLQWGGLQWGGLQWSGLQWGGDDIDPATAASQGFAPPNQFTATVITNTCGVDPATCHRTRLQWKAPNAGTVIGASGYHVYRVHGAISTGSLPVPVAGTPTLVSGQWQLIDMTELPYNQTFTYFVTADFAPSSHTPATTSGPSNFSAITSVNTSPVANNDTFAGRKNRPNTVAVLSNDVDEDTVPARLTPILVSQQATGGTLTLNANGTFTYVPTSGFSGPFIFFYKVTNGTFTDALGTVPMSLQDSATVMVTINLN